MLRSRRVFVFTFPFVLAACSAQVSALPPASPSTGTGVIRAMHDRYASTWYATVSFTERAEQRAANGAMKSEIWYEEAKLPGRLRIDVGVPATNTATKRKTMLFVNGNIYVRIPGKPLKQTAGLNPLLLLGFDIYRQPVNKTVTQLKSQGFDLSRVHKAVWRGRPVYVVGAATGDLKSKQFWVDAKRLLFVRLIDPSATNLGGNDEVLFEGYRRLAGGWISTDVTASKNGVVQFHEKYWDIKANVSLPDAWFDPASLR